MKTKASEPVITYEVIVERNNGTKVVLLDKVGKVGITEFKKLAEEQITKSTTKRIYAIRKVDGVEDGNGVIMRYIGKNDNYVISLPKGLYHKIDCAIDQTKLKPIKIRLEEDDF